MAALPQNVERLRDGRGYRYRAYDANGWIVRLRRDPTSGFWHGYRNHDGKYMGLGRTIAEIAAKIGSK